MLVVFAGLFYFFKADFNPTKLSRTQKDALREAVNDIKEQILAPEPLRISRESVQSHLTLAGVIAETNKQRRLNGLAALTQNLDLDAAALRKVNDMFAHQYFAHESPSGKNAGDLAKEAGYAYIVIGENLALGNFTDDADLVAAWMASPGHRANILHEKFQEIGVAVKRGTFEGKTTWLAVQEFGTPRSACPQPDERIKAQISTNETELASLQQAITQQHAEIEGGPRGPRAQFEQKIAAYNALVEQYNALVDATKNLVSRYNLQVQNTNACITAP